MAVWDSSSGCVVEGRVYSAVTRARWVGLGSVTEESLEFSTDSGRGISGWLVWSPVDGGEAVAAGAMVLGMQLIWDDLAKERLDEVTRFQRRAALPQAVDFGERERGGATLVSESFSRFNMYSCGVLVGMDQKLAGKGKAQEPGGPCTI